MLHKLMLVSFFSLPWWSAGILLGTVCRPQAPTSVEPTEVQMSFVKWCLQAATKITRRMQSLWGDRHVPASESLPHWRHKVWPPLVDVMNRLKVHLEIHVSMIKCHVFAVLDSHHLLPLRIVDRCDCWSLARPWFWRSRICSKAGHDTRHLKIWYSRGILRPSAVWKHLRQSKPGIDSHAEVEEYRDHVENLVEHAMLGVPLSISSIWHWKQISWEIEMKQTGQRCNNHLIWGKPWHRQAL